MPLDDYEGFNTDAHHEDPFERLWSFLKDTFKMREATIEKMKLIFANNNIDAIESIALFTTDELIKLFGDNIQLLRALETFLKEDIHFASIRERVHISSQAIQSNKNNTALPVELVTPTTIEDQRRDREKKWNDILRKRFRLEIQLVSSDTYKCPIRGKILKLGRCFKISNIISSYKTLNTRSSQLRKKRDFYYDLFMKRWRLEGKSDDEVKSQLSKLVLTCTSIEEICRWDKMFGGRKRVEHPTDTQDDDVGDTEEQEDGDEDQYEEEDDEELR